jgi:hypothetical protein
MIMDKDRTSLSDLSLKNYEAYPLIVSTITSKYRVTRGLGAKFAQSRAVINS